KASRLAAMGSSLAAISSAIAKEAGISECRRLIVESEEGVVAVMTVPDSSPPLVLAVVANDASRLGQLLWGAKHCCAALSKKLKK
ncbi:MAG: roadblock/LC7 domain-containing protein, partial [Alcanivorax sp.]